MGQFDLVAHVERSRSGPCFVCAYISGDPEYEHEPLYADDHVVAFLSRYPTLLGYSIVAPRAHVIDVTRDRNLFRRLNEVVYDVAEAPKAADGRQPFSLRPKPRQAGRGRPEHRPVSHMRATGLRAPAEASLCVSVLAIPAQDPNEASQASCYAI
jgi:hypothetical protein